MAKVPGFAKGLIAQHHAEGRKVIMATTSPFDLVKPLADALGVVWIDRARVRDVKRVIPLIADRLRSGTSVLLVLKLGFGW